MAQASWRDAVDTAYCIRSNDTPFLSTVTTRRNGAGRAKPHYGIFMTGPETMVEFFHGYTFSGNPMACAAALATLDTHEEEGLFTRGAELSDYWQDAVHSLKGLPHVLDLRNMGLIAGIELEPRAGEPAARGFKAFLKAYEAGLLIRTTGDTIALSPPLIIEKSHIDVAFGTIADILKSLE